MSWPGPLPCWAIYWWTGICSSWRAGAGPNTLRAAAFDLKTFFAVTGKDPVEVTAADVFDFLAHQRGDRTVVRLADRESGLSARTIARHLSSVSGLYACLVARGDAPVQVNPVPRGLSTRRQGGSRRSRTAPLVRVPRTLPRILSPQEAGRLVGALRTHRDRAMLQAMLLAGLRRCEVLGLRFADVQVADRRLAVVEGKGGHHQIVPVANRFFGALGDYLHDERTGRASTDRVFVVLKGPRRGLPLSAEGLDEILAGARRRAGLEHATCHELRHTCLTRLREAGMALEAVQAQAGHLSIESTRIYLHLTNDRLAGEYRRAARADRRRCRGRGRDAETHRQRLRTVRQFFERIIEWDWPDAPARNPVIGGDIPKKPEPLPKFPGDRDAARLMAAARASTDPCHRLVVELLARTGMRAGELADLEADAVVRIGAGHWLRIPLGKLRNDRYVPLHPELARLLAAWTAANLEHIRRHKRLIADHRGSLDRRLIGPIVHRAGRAAGVPGVHPHRLRHTLATQAINRGMRPEAIAALLGHRKMEMTPPRTAARAAAASGTPVSRITPPPCRATRLASGEAPAIATEAWSGTGCAAHPGTRRRTAVGHHHRGQVGARPCSGPGAGWSACRRARRPVGLRRPGLGRPGS